ncbi:MAG: ATP-dependent Clp protease ATP-binding subunit [Candidatus Paceibacterota bacterium]
MFQIYFKDDYYKLSFFGRLLSRVFIATFTAITVIGSAVFILSESANLRFGGVLLAFFAGDRIFHLSKSRKSIKKLPRGGKINVADYISPKAKNMAAAAFNRAVLGERDLSVEMMLETLTVREVKEAIRRLGIDPVKVKERVIEISGKNFPKQDKNLLKDKMETTAKEAFKIALKAGERSVTPADFLVAQGRAGSDSVIKVFRLFDIDPDDLEKALIFGRLAKERNVPSTSFFARRMPTTKIRSVNRAWTSRPTPTLDMFGFDITDMAVAGKSGFLIGHKNEYERLEDILSRPTKPNALLVGEPGVGKETIVGYLAYRILKDQVPSNLFDKRLVALNISALSSGADQAELQRRINKIINEIREAGNVILYIPEIHNLSRTSGEMYLSAANILLPLISGDEFPTIGTTYPKEYKQYIDQDSAFAGVFESIPVGEISEDEAEEYLSYESVVLEREWKIEISFASIKKAVLIAKKYFHKKPLPSSAEDLLKEALSEARRRGDDVLDESDIIRAAEKRVNIPIHHAGPAEAEKLLNLEAEIHKRLVDQEEAVGAVSRSLREYRSGLSRKGGPIASFLFVGPTGVGKTELAKILAAIQFGSEEMMVRIDMSEYQDTGSVSRLIGSSGGKIYGALTESVSEKPYSLILLDEFEKANGDVLNLFLQVLDDGRLTDGLGRTVDFQNTIIIATSNAHSGFIKDSLDKGEDPAQISEILKKRLTEYFKPELLNRFSDIISFKTLSVSDMEKITKLNLASLAGMLEESQGIMINFDDRAVAALARQGYDPTFGARPLRNAISKSIKDPLSSKILLGDIKRGDIVSVSCGEDGVFSFSPAS